MPTKYAVIKARREADPEYAERMRSYSRKYREANVEKERERQRKAKAVKRDENRDAYNAYMREYNSKNMPARARKVKEKRDANPEYAERLKTRTELSVAEHQKHWKLKKLYGIGLDDLNRMKMAQDNCCALCGVHESKSGKKGLVVDHCHSRGHVRGILCTNCNAGLGQFKDNVSLLKKAIDYLTKQRR